MNIIEKLYYGEINPNSREYCSNTLNEIENLESVLREKLEHKDINILLAYFDAHNTYQQEIAYHNFENGFRLAYKFVFEGLK
ncbi:MAG: hypothetical protein FWG33_02780 [Oscillospiraceae bacterium]|nr:hypothetical protein [Oscillospiraceae bacterium]